MTDLRWIPRDPPTRASLTNPAGLVATVSPIRNVRETLRIPMESAFPAGPCVFRGRPSVPYDS